MSKQTFFVYLHDGFNSHERREIMEEAGIVLSEEAWKNLGSPFYEVQLECEVDDQGNVTILEVK